MVGEKARIAAAEIDEAGTPCTWMAVHSRRVDSARAVDNEFGGGGYLSDWWCCGRRPLWRSKFPQSFAFIRDSNLSTCRSILSRRAFNLSNPDVIGSTEAFPDWSGRRGGPICSAGVASLVGRSDVDGPCMLTSCVLTEGSDPVSPECVENLPQECFSPFYHEMCEDAYASVDISDNCCSFFSLNYDCFFYGLVKKFESMHLCDDKLGSGRAQIIWNTCYSGYTKL
ncbi:hypothetical protein SASPL_136496 [Salvia splendens]|uniref:Uncharacterized protein n=1 Tax=Salvia splendens TaxID=180675 RepID=A0A8X8X295_SALSN|nr:hypothetical protein SASPL_136496 [Salvia splendens]